MNAQTERLSLAGGAGPIEAARDGAAAGVAPCGVAIIAHPHPLFGGTMDNKVVQTLARAFVASGYQAVRFNFRGVGGSAGVHDEGRGETEDLLAVLHNAQLRCGDIPVVLAGFSFGAYCQTRVARRLADAGRPAQRLVLVGTAAGFVEGLRQYDTESVPHDTIVIHGSADTTVPLANVLAWAETNDLPVTVVPGADHFFHRRLHQIRDIITRAWRH